MQSSIRSQFRMSTFLLSSVSIMAFTFVDEFILLSSSFAAADLCFPTSSSRKSDCLCRLLSSTWSLSIIVISPMPALASSSAVLVPRPPHPTIVILLLCSSSCFSFPMYSNIICLEYLMFVM